MKLSERSIRIKELLPDTLDMGTFGLIELELIEFDKRIEQLKDLLMEASSIYNEDSEPDQKWEERKQSLLNPSNK